ncbi:hypothetical protein AMTRI_Chr11g95030 [Amborella trichopoda]
MQMEETTLRSERSEDIASYKDAGLESASGSSRKSVELDMATILGRKVSISRRGGLRSKSRSAQIRGDIDEVINGVNGSSIEDVGATLSRASSASLGLSFCLSGIAMPPDNILSDIGRFNRSDYVQEEVTEETGSDWEKDLESGNHNKIKSEPTYPISLKFTDVKYQVGKNGGEEKYILHGVTGSAQPGEVLALMGPSGGGKTTLLNLLSGRVEKNVPRGTITYNDLPYSKSLKRRIGFVLQDDIVFSHLTVKETLTYAALLRLPRTLSKQQKEERAMDVIMKLGLERCQDTLIGGAFTRGISGGERKRVCIGNEILLNPSLLFLDEPTSGLDSTTALRIIQILHDIAEAGKTVVITIHQPSSRLFHKFDKLILLGKGSLLYSGKALEAMVYFNSIGCSPLIAMNPAEFLIDLANGNINDKSIPSELEDKVLLESSRVEIVDAKPSPSDVHEYLVEAYETRVADCEKKKVLKPAQTDDDWNNSHAVLRSREWRASWWQQFTILFCRSLKQRRHDHLSWMRVTQVLSTAIILGLLWWHSDNSSTKEVQDQAGLLFFIAVFWGFFPVFTAIFTFPQERAMLAKERAVDMYKLSAYFMARITSDLPLDMILPVIFLLIVYFMVGLKASTSAFFLSMITLFLSIVAAQGLGLVIGASLMDAKKATTLASVVVMTFMLAGGFFVQNVPSFISWIRYISFNYHTYRLLLKIQYSCSGSNSCKSFSIKGITLDSGGREACAMIAMVFGYRFLAYISLRRMKLTSVT